jgi:hypothetical protein
VRILGRNGEYFVKTVFLFDIRLFSSDDDDDDDDDDDSDEGDSDSDDSEMDTE